MKALLLATGLLSLALGAPAQTPVARTPTQVQALTKDYATWYRYVYQQAPLARDFKPLDRAGNLLTRKAFLQQLLRGNVLAFSNGREQRRPV